MINFAFACLFWMPSSWLVLLCGAAQQSTRRRRAGQPAAVHQCAGRRNAMRAGGRRRRRGTAHVKASQGPSARRANIISTLFLRASIASEAGGGPPTPTIRHTLGDDGGAFAHFCSANCYSSVVGDVYQAFRRSDLFSRPQPNRRRTGRRTKSTLCGALAGKTSSNILRSPIVRVHDGVTLSVTSK